MQTSYFTEIGEANIFHLLSAPDTMYDICKFTEETESPVKRNFDDSFLQT